MDIRTGFGYDIHALSPIKGHFLLAGVEIQGDYSIVSHSDGDIVYHSLSNAILSSLGMEDIGFYFPDNKEETKGMNSLDILNFALSEMKKRGYEIKNAVIDIVLERPKLLPYREAIKKNLSLALYLPLDRIGLSANTNEKLGPVGESKAIVVYSNVLIDKKD